jgi:hypothetical protein
MSTFLILGLAGLLTALIYIFRNAVVAEVELKFNQAHAWAVSQEAAVEHKVVNELEHIWTVTITSAGVVTKGIGATLTAAVENLKSKLYE